MSKGISKSHLFQHHQFISIPKGISLLIYVIFTGIKISNEDVM